MKKGKYVEISSKELSSLADKLEKFSSELSGDEQTMLSAMVVLANRQLTGVAPERLQIDRDEKRLEGLQAGFANAFARFAPEAFPDPEQFGTRIVSGTVCIE